MELGRQTDKHHTYTVQHIEKTKEHDEINRVRRDEINRVRRDEINRVRRDEINRVRRDEISIGYTMRMRGYRIYTTEGEARGRVYSMTQNPNFITGLYQNAEAFPLPIGSSRAVQCN